MEVAQMLTHCAVVYEMIFEDSLPKPKRLKKWLIKTFVKNTVVNERPYKKKQPNCTLVSGNASQKL